MQIGILGFRIGLQVGGFGGPVGILPHDESFVQGVEAVTTKAGGADGKSFLISLGVCEIQGQGVSDPALFLQRFNHLVDEIACHRFVPMGEDEVHISTASF